jgi:hypothetical protein
MLGSRLAKGSFLALGALGAALSLAACSGEATGVAALPLHPSTGSSLRVLTYNTAFMQVSLAPPIGTIDTNAGMFGDLDYHERAQRIAAGILRDDNDVVVLNEVFSAEARAILVGALAATYPFHLDRLKGQAPDPYAAGVALLFAPGTELAETNDSGLMLFSKHPFVPFTAGTSPSYDIDEVDGSAAGVPWGSSASEVSVVTFPLSLGADGLASKAVAMVRVQNPNDGQISNIAFSHTQASYGSPDLTGPLVRSLQLRTAQNLIRRSLTATELATQPVYLLGDLNIIGGNQKDSGPDPEWESVFFKQVVADGFFACGDGPCDFDPATAKGHTFLSDSWGFETSPLDLGISNTVDKARLDYVLHNRPELTDFSVKPIVKTGLCMQHAMIAYELGDPVGGGLQQLSDHLGVRVDFNKSAPHCSPNPDGGALGPVPVAFPAASQDLQVTSPAAAITFPGSMQWYRIDKAGSYSIKASTTAPNRVGFAVYQGEDLSRPIPPFYGETTRWGDKFAMTKPPYYVRVFGQDPTTGKPDRAFTGGYTIDLHEHRGITPKDSISLAGGFPTEYVWPGPGIPELPVVWFDFHTNTTTAGKFPDVAFYEEVPTADDPSQYAVTIVEDTPALPVIPGAGTSIIKDPSTLLRSLVVAAPALAGIAGGAPRKYFVRVGRDAALQNTPSVTRLTFGTTLTYLRPERLTSYNMADDWPDRDNIELGFMVDGPVAKSSCNASCIGPIPFSTGSPTTISGYPSLQRTFVDNVVFNLWKEGTYLAPHFTSGGQPLGMPNLSHFQVGYNTDLPFIWADGGNPDAADYWYEMTYETSHDATKH